MDIEYELQQLYERWLMDTYSDEIHNKEDLITLFDNEAHYDEFMDAIKKSL